MACVLCADQDVAFGFTWLTFVIQTKGLLIHICTKSLEPPCLAIAEPTLFALLPELLKSRGTRDQLCPLGLFRCGVLYLKYLNCGSTLVVLNGKITKLGLNIQCYQSVYSSPLTALPTSSYRTSCSCHRAIE